MATKVTTNVTVLHVPQKIAIKYVVSHRPADLTSINEKHPSEMTIASFVLFVFSFLSNRPTDPALSRRRGRWGNETLHIEMALDNDRFG